MEVFFFVCVVFGSYKPSRSEETLSVQVWRRYSEFNSFRSYLVDSYPAVSALFTPGAFRNAVLLSVKPKHYCSSQHTVVFIPAVVGVTCLYVGLVSIGCVIAFCLLCSLSLAY